MIDCPQALIDLSSGSSSLVPALSPLCDRTDPIQASVLHLVLPELAVPVVSGADPVALADFIGDSLWQVFSSVREWHRKLQDAKATMLVWAWPGETIDRPSAPIDGVSAAVCASSSEQLSLLPALSGLLRCMVLELDRSMVLLGTDLALQPEELRDATAFLATGAVVLGDCTLVQHRLRSHEPRIIPTDFYGNDRARPLDGHILSLGGARGIVAEMLTQLTADHSHLSVVGRTALEQPDPELLGLCSQDLMRALMLRHRQSGDQSALTPRSLQREVDRIQRQAALNQHLEALGQIVDVFDYHNVDLTHGKSLMALLKQDAMKDICVLISGAGVIQDQSCLTKSRDSFDAVLRTKVMPLCVLLSHGLPSSLKTWLSFSSIASKSGNPGQADYAAANEFLNTVVHWFSVRHPDICMRTINWGPWQGSGMVSTEVLQAFHSRGLDSVEPDAAAEMLRQILAPEWAAVELSGLALQPQVALRLQRQQSLMAASPLWEYHCIPVPDPLATNDLRLLFHEGIPYLQGHRKRGRAVVPAALMLCLAADVAASVQALRSRPLHLNLYVFNGITIPLGSAAVIVQAQIESVDDGESGMLTVKQAKSERPHYKVAWSWGKESLAHAWTWSFSPDLPSSLLLYCDHADVYSACLFHSGVMASLCDRIVIDPASQTSWCRARPTQLKDQLGIDRLKSGTPLLSTDLTLVDALLQLLLVQTIETHGFSALPQELSMVLLNPMPVDDEVELTITILDIQGSCLVAAGACRDSHGDLLFVMEKSKFTISKDLLDYPPGIIRSGEV